MRPALPIAALCLLAAGCGGPPPAGPQKVGPAVVTLQPRPDPAREGLGSGFVVSIREGGRPVSGVQVHLQLYFRSFNQVGPAADAAEESPGNYVASEMTTGKAGQWEAEVSLKGPRGISGTANFPFRVVPDSG